MIVEIVWPLHLTSEKILLQPNFYSRLCAVQGFSTPDLGRVAYDMMRLAYPFCVAFAASFVVSVAAQYSEYAFCSPPFPSGGDSDSCRSTLDCLQELSGVCVDLILPDDVRMNIENSTLTTVEVVELMYKSLLCSIFDTPDLKAIGQDACSILSGSTASRRQQEDEYKIKSNEASGHREMQATFVNPDYPNKGTTEGETDYERLVLPDIFTGFLTGGANRRSSSDRYSKFAFEDVRSIRKRLEQTKSNCALGVQAASGVGGILSIIPGAGAIAGVFTSQSTGVCAQVVFQTEFELADASSRLARIDAHDSLIFQAEIAAIEPNVRMIGSAVNDLATKNTEGQARIEMKVDAFAATTQANFNALNMRIDSLTTTLNNIAEAIDSNFRADSLRIDELQQTLTNVIAIATATDVAVTIIRGYFDD